MNFRFVRPKNMGITRLKNIAVEQLVAYIDWKFFFRTWRLVGNYSGIETLCDCTACCEKWLLQFSENERAQAHEALHLWRDAQALLQRLTAEKLVNVEAAVGLFPAQSDGENITLHTENGDFLLPMLRQQEPNDEGFCLSLADFVANYDFLGAFAVAVHLVGEKNNNDDYDSLLLQSLLDRLAEAAAEFLHERVRKDLWGFAADEQLSVDEMKRSLFVGIRPAVGYPSLPDQSLLFELARVLPLNDLGIELTENGAMCPSSSVCGLIFAHPAARYFRIGRISQEQLQDYARRRAMSVEELSKFISAEIID